MKSFYSNPLAILASMRENGGLIGSLSAREIAERYKESFMGFAWAVIQPLFIIVIYVFVFTFVFKSRWPDGSGSKSEFALVLFAGLLVFNMFAEMLNRSPQLILEKRNYVKRVVFPLEIMPCVCAATAGFNLVVSTGIWLIFYMIADGVPHLTILLFPVILIPFICFMLGISWLLASLGVYLRDIAQVTAIVTTGAMFLTPIFYSPASFPPKLRALLNLNPLTIVVRQVRDVLIWGRMPNVFVYCACLFISLLVMWGGFAFFQQTRKGFADVI